jgi:hypothetical protein
MDTSTRTLAAPMPTRWAGRILSGLAVAFLLMDGVIKVLMLPPAVEATVGLGYPAHLVLGIGVLELLCLAAYALPRTAPIGAILLTGYLGGALATQVRVGAPTFSLVFPLLLGALVWGGLLLRDERVRGLFQLR